MRRGLPASILLALLLTVSGCADSPRVAAEGEGLPLSALDSLVAEGEALYWQGEFEDARTLWTQALQGLTLPDSAAEPRILTWLGLAAWRQGDYPEARRLGEQALTLKLQQGQREDLFRSYNALGLLAWTEGRLGANTVVRWENGKVGPNAATNALLRLLASTAHTSPTAASPAAVAAIRDLAPTARSRAARERRSGAGRPLPAWSSSGPLQRSLPVYRLRCQEGSPLSVCGDEETLHRRRS